MNKARGLILIVVLAVTAVIIAVWINHSKKAEPTPESSITSTEEHSEEPTADTSTPENVVLTMDEWTDVVLAALDCTGENGEVTVDADNTMTVSGELPKSTIESWLDEGNVDLNSMYSTILAALPDSIPMTLTCAITCEQGNVMLQGKGLKVSGVDLPTELISDSAWEGINQSLNEQLSTHIDGVSSITFDEKDKSVMLKPLK